LVIPDEFRQAWRQTGLALDRTGFAVEDRNRSEGCSSCATMIQTQRRQEKGLVSGWRSGARTTSTPSKQYQVKLGG
jgi:outer membrane protein assembly factor BamC